MITPPNDCHEYRMIKSAKMNGFRCLREVKLDGLRRINLIVGDNSAGKTTLLEGLFLANGGSPEIAMRFKRWRTGEANFTGSIASLNREIWGELFHQFDITKPISIDLVASDHGNRSLIVTSGQDSLVPLNENASPDFLPVFEWNLPSGQFQLKPKITEQGLDLGGKIAPTPTEIFFFPSSQPISSAETAGRFFDLSRRNNEKAVVAEVNRQFPSITDLTVGISSGTNALYATVAGMPDKIPLSLVSSGLNKLVALLCALPTKRGSVLLVDEIENGLHYKRLPAVWSALLSMCETHQGQVFASTHSDECLRAAAALAEKRPKDFSVIHIGKDGVRQFSGERFVEAIEHNIEIR